jgi:curved DNA-binding protein CbpA
MATAINPYKVLGVSENATQEEIKSAFRKLSKQSHPDTSGDSSQDFINIKKAYEILSSNEKRNTYDLYGVVIDFPKEAENLAFTIFLDVATKCPVGEPLDGELKSFITLVLIPKCEAEMKSAEEKKNLLETRLSAIVSKPDTDDFITKRTLKVIDEYDQQYKMALLKRDLHKTALELLQKYKFNLNQIGDSSMLFRNEEDREMLYKKWCLGL